MKATSCLILIFSFFIFSSHAQSDSWTKLDEKGTSLFNEQKFEESLEVFLEAVDAAKQEFGTNHVNYAGTLKSVGILYYYLEQAEESEKYFNDALQAYERINGKLRYSALRQPMF